MAIWTILDVHFISNAEVSVAVERPAEGTETMPVRFDIRLASDVLDLNAAQRRAALIAAIQVQLAEQALQATRRNKLDTLRTNIIGATVDA